MPTVGALALMAFVDPGADPKLRYEGALLVFSAIEDLFLIRSYFLERQGD